MNCRFCGNNTAEFEVKNKKYYQCTICKGVFLDEIHFLTPEKQKERYELHNNSLTDMGYKQFLEQFALPVLDFCKKKKKTIDSILDYGSGPSPALLELLEEYKKNSILDADITLLGWDPFFMNGDMENFQKVSLITCLEVVEHFENPLVDFQKISTLCKKGGILSIGTMEVPEEKSIFYKWWYKDDPTHVSFYSEKAIQKCGERSGFSYLGKINSRIFVFEKL